MLALRPVRDSRHSAVRVSGIPLSRIFNALGPTYEYTPEQIRGLAEKLKQAGLIQEIDKFGFVAPTGKGEELIGALLGLPEEDTATIPDLPSGI